MWVDTKFLLFPPNWSVCILKRFHLPMIGFLNIFNILYVMHACSFVHYFGWHEFSRANGLLLSKLETIRQECTSWREGMIGLTIWYELNHPSPSRCKGENTKRRRHKLATARWCRFWYWCEMRANLKTLGSRHSSHRQSFSERCEEVTHTFHPFRNRMNVAFSKIYKCILQTDDRGWKQTKFVSYFCQI